MRTKDIVFAVGPAGTGKTYMAVAYAVSLFVEGKINRLILRDQPWKQEND